MMSQGAWVDIVWCTLLVWGFVEGVEQCSENSCGGPSTQEEVVVRAEELPGFEQFPFAYEKWTKVVYRIGEQDAPAVVLMHELPGMVPECIGLARRLADEGFCVFMPLLFGKPGQFSMVGNTLRICLRREFLLFARRKSSPITRWLRALCREAKDRCGCRGVGVIGMCLTGGFGLSLMADDAVLAPVLSQPSLPIGRSHASRCALGTTPADLERAKARSQQENIPVMGLRFTGDILCPAERFDALEEAFGERFRRIEIDSSPGNPHGLSRTSHSVLTIDYQATEGHPTRQAYDEVIAFFHTQLAPPPSA